MWALSSEPAPLPPGCATSDKSHHLPKPRGLLHARWEKLVTYNASPPHLRPDPRGAEDIPHMPLMVYAATRLVRPCNVHEVTVATPRLLCREKGPRGELPVQEQADTWGSRCTAVPADGHTHECLHPGLETPGESVHGRMDKEDACRHNGVLLSRKKGGRKSGRFQQPGGLGGHYAKGDESAEKDRGCMVSLTDAEPEQAELTGTETGTVAEGLARGDTGRCWSRGTDRQ
ncbi:uncharacterized protein LOC123944400 [Meles meles]|uniref:uncharacterized protein LOC123944400 n=1 Tax=Meles meles TaxID=9662 RepID=UPI001E6A0261|nr:uncharacterized protein LOC123944400 [Meles meles]